jgi:hypothetical protein
LLNVLQRPELLSTLLEGMSDGLSIIVAHGVQVYVNDALWRPSSASRAVM